MWPPQCLILNLQGPLNSLTTTLDAEAAVRLLTSGLLDLQARGKQVNSYQNYAIMLNKSAIILILANAKHRVYNV